jgi:hypothetical protein
MLHRSCRLVFAPILLVLVSSSGCATSSGASTDEEASSTKTRPSTAPSGSKRGRGSTAKPPGDWIAKRVDRARERLSDSKAGRVLWESIQAHGGLETWYANGPLYFHYNYQPVGDGTPRNTYQTVDTWSARARHQMAERREREYGWDGEHAWYRPGDWEPPYDVRFWALTPYYFVGMPFVLADPGVNLTHEGRATLEGESCEVIRATFGDVGISPDDFYVLYIDRDDHVFRGLRYIVSYPKYFPEGGHSPEKLMTYDGRQRVDGILFAESYRFYKWQPDSKTNAPKVTDADLTDVAFRPETPNAYFEVPDDATIVDGGD